MEAALVSRYIECLSMKPHVLVLVDRFPLDSDYTPSTWMIGSLMELAAIAEIDVASVVNLLPRIRNITRSRRERASLKAAWWSTITKMPKYPFSIRHFRYFGLPARISWKLLPRLITWQILHRIIKTYKTHQYDAIVIHGTYPVGYLGLELAKHFGVPSIVINHEGYQLYQEYFSSAATLELFHVLSNADMIAGLSPNHVRELRNDFPSKIIEMICHGISIPQTPAQTDQMNKEHFRVLTVSRLDGNEKQVSPLIEGFIQFVQTNKIHAHLTIAGDGTDLPFLKQFVLKRHAEGIVHFCGWVGVNKLQELFRSHDVFVCASSHETFCYAILEAVAYGLPVMGLPNVGILSEFVTLFTEETALLKLTSSQIAEKLLSFYQSKNRWRQIGDAMVQVARERYTWDMHRKSWQHVLNQLVRMRKS
jgi:glycosyltransferase involved in cell wall biosynthesis